MAGKLISAKEYAERIGVRYVTVRTWINRGKLPKTRIGNVWAIPEDTPWPADRLYVENPGRNRRKNDPR